MMAARVATPALLAAVMANAQQSNNPVITIDMFRAMGASGVSSFTEENDDLADLTGVVKYIHTECIAEHTMSPPGRTTRKNGIDILGRWRMKVKNSIDILNSNGQQVDFGPFQAYDVGQSTNAQLDEVMSTDGDFVGIQLQANDARYPTFDPFYWYSISGFCPNLPWVCTKGAAPEDCYGGKPITPTMRCSDDPCPGKGTRENPNKQCLTYFDTGEKQDIVYGGLCNATDSGVDPTGQHGCVYSYKKEEIIQVKVDELVGIYDQDCREKGEYRKCKDWLDFRRHCTNSTLKRKFGEGGVIETNVGYCVEYDVHPACVNDCNTEACKNADVIELGLPFWQGRCEKKANRIRVERLAKLFGWDGAETAHTIVDPAQVPTFAKCTGHAGAGVCNPDMNSGGPFCTRAWSGVCTNCYIPGTNHFYPANATQPTCPLDVLTLPDYKDMVGMQCKSASAEKGPAPRDLCCIYTEQCGDGYDMDPTTTSLDDDGLAVAKAKTIRKKDTQVLIDFLTRVATDAGYGKYVKDTEGITEIAYWQWSVGISMDDSLDNLKDRMKDMFTDTKPTDAPTPAPTPGPAGGGGGPPTGLIVGIVVIVLLLGAVAAFLVRRRQQARNANISLLNAADQQA